MTDLDMFWLGQALGRPEECSEEVSRGGIVQPCEKPAVALRFDPHEAGQVYPVCAHHARAEMVPLVQVVRFFLDRADAAATVARGLQRMGEKPQGRGIDG